MPQPRAVLSLIILSTFAATSLAVGTDCFVPNGTDRNEGTDVSPGSVAYVPCDQRAPFSMCCRYGGDDCLPNGLCQGHASDGSEPIWRESCTDPTWTSPYCLKLCLTGKTPSGFDYSQGDVTVHQCPDQSFCCGQYNTTCCGTSDAKWIVNGQVTNINPNSTTSATSSTSTTSSRTSSSTSSTTATLSSGQAGNQQGSQSNHGGTNVGAIAGGVIGGVVALAIIGTALWFFMRRGHNGREEQQHHQPDSYYASPNASGPRYQIQPGLHEAEGGSDGLDQKAMSEVDGRARYEIGYQKKDRVGRQELE